MQVVPVKPTSKASGTKRLKVKHVKLLSSFAFKSNLRRYTAEPFVRITVCGRGLNSSTFQLNLTRFLRDRGDM